jgi:hypothetical protein
MLDESATTLDPKGLARVLLGVSIFFLIPTAIIVILRCFVRLKYRLFGIDDGLMLIGWVSLSHSETKHSTNRVRYFTLHSLLLVFVPFMEAWEQKMKT